MRSSLPSSRRGGSPGHPYISSLYCWKSSSAFFESHPRSSCNAESPAHSSWASPKMHSRPNDHQLFDQISPNVISSPAVVLIGLLVGIGFSFAIVHCRHRASRNGDEPLLCTHCGSATGKKVWRFKKFFKKVFGCPN